MYIVCVKMPLTSTPCCRLSVGPPAPPQQSPLSLGEYLRQLSKHRNFMWFSSMNLLQVRSAGGRPGVVKGWSRGRPGVVQGLLAAWDAKLRQHGFSIGGDSFDSFSRHTNNAYLEIGFNSRKSFFTFGLFVVSTQVFHCHFNSNFFPLFLEHLLSDSISASTGSILLGKTDTTSYPLTASS